MSLNWEKILSVTMFVSLSLFALTGFGCRRTGTTGADDPSRTLVVWGLWQESNDMVPILKSFEEQTGIKVKYQKVAPIDTYEKDLLAALAEGRGPDVFVIHHTWINDKRGILSPAPDEVVDARAVNEEFVDVVGKDVIRENKVWALPTSVDTLVLYFNKDIFNGAGIAQPPKTWTDFQQIVQRITKVNRLGSIQQSAAAMGTAANINRAPDMLQLLMLQSNVPIINEQGAVNIATDTGERALTFYTDFANRGKKVYTWNLQQDYSIDSFAEGETAMMFNYSYHMATVKAKNPRLNFGIAPMPQIAGSAESEYKNFAAYWPFAVANASPNPQAAWQFVRFLTNQAMSQQINLAQGVPPARVDSVVELQRDPVMGVFADQTLTADTWPRVDIAAVDTIFNQMIDDVVTGATTGESALRRTEDQLNAMQKDNQTLDQ